tara:strand:- start:597 stop:2225 length:1629 start_codon:yes stop_codon:yes gene_type:complete
MSHSGSRKNGIKISEFISAGIEDSHQLTFIGNGINYRITFSGFKSALGVTGTLQQAGDITGAPILDVQGSDNFIRNLEDGSGFKASVSPQNGVTVEHNFTAGTDGIAVLGNPSALSPVIRSIKGSGDISVALLDDAIVVSGATSGLVNRVIVGQASDLAGVLDGTKEYFIDGVIDMGAQSIEVPAAGLNLTGYNFDASKLISSADGYTMFTSPAGGSGNILGKDYAIEVTGTGSKVYNITSVSGFDAFEFARINYNDCTSLGTITDYRQGLEVGTGRFGGRPELTLAGTWLGGYFIDTSIVRSLADGAYSLFKAGAGFVMSSRFRSNQNIDLPAAASFFDFASANFVNPSTVQIEGAIITRNGVFNATDANIAPNMAQGDLVANWMGNNGMPNTFVGGSIGVTTSAVTTISVDGQYEDLSAALWTSADLQHFDAPSGNQLRHLGNTPREYSVVASFVLESVANDTVALRVSRFDSSAASPSTVLTQTRQVNNLVGGRNVAFFNININTELDENDYIFLEVANIGNTSDVTAEADSYYIVEAR